MATFHPGQLVSVNDNEAAGQLLVMRVTNEAKPVKCLSLNAAFSTPGFLAFQAYSPDELELADSSQPYFLAKNSRRDLQEWLLPLYRHLLTQPAPQQPRIFSAVLDETAEYLTPADKDQLNKARAYVQGRGQPVHEAILHLLATPRVTLHTLATLGDFLQRAGESLTTSSR